MILATVAPHCLVLPPSATPPNTESCLLPHLIIRKHFMHGTLKREELGGLLLKRGSLGEMATSTCFPHAVYRWSYLVRSASVAARHARQRSLSISQLGRFQTHFDEQRAEQINSLERNSAVTATWVTSCSGKGGLAVLNLAAR